MTRRAGQIVPKGDKKYLLRVPTGKDPETGRRKYSNKLFLGTHSQAQKELTKLLREVHTNTHVEPNSYTVKTWLAHWLDSVVKLKGSAGATQRSYANRIVRINKALGAIRLVDLQTPAVQQMVADMHKEGLSPRTIQYTVTVLKQSMKYAKKTRMIQANPCEDLVMPAVKKAVKQAKVREEVLTPEQVSLFLENTTEHPRYPLFHTLLTTGLRPQEALALEWPDLKTDKEPLLSITKSAKLQDDGSVAVEQAAKTDSGIRTVTIPLETLRVLQEHRKKQAEAILKAGEGFQRNNLIFPNEVGNLLDGSKVGREWKMALKSLGMTPRRLYAARHTHFTLLLAAGVHPKIVSERAGHANIQITLDTYSHVLPSMQAGVSEKLTGMLFKTAGL